MIDVPTAASGAELRHHLGDVGFAVVDGVDLEGYRALARSLGTILHEDGIAVVDGARNYVRKPEAVPLHTDHPQVETIAWWCEQQDDVDGASLLLDARPALAALSHDDRRALRATDLTCRPLATGQPPVRCPIVRSAPRGELFFFAPWLPVAAPVAAVAALRAHLDAGLAAPTARVRLRPGQALFVDNQRVLHGRGAIAATSRRCLQRVWVG